MSKSEDELMIERLKFCGCGSPDDVLSLFYDFIKLIQHQRAINPPTFLGKEWEKYCEAKREEKKQFVIEHAEKFVWLMFYVLDEKRIFTHGGNVSGGWLDDHAFFEQLEQWHKAREIERMQSE